MKLIRLPDVIAKIKIKRTAIYRQIKKGALPAPIKIGSSSFWVEGEIESYLTRLMSARQASPPMSAS